MPNQKILNFPAKGHIRKLRDPKGGTKARAPIARTSGGQWGTAGDRTPEGGVFEYALKVLCFGFFFIVLFYSLTSFAKDKKAAETQFWRFQLFLKVDSAPYQRKALLYLPFSHDQQEILSLRRYAPEYKFEETYQNGNLQGIWTSMPESKHPNWIIYDTSVKIIEQLPPKKLQKSHAQPDEFFEEAQLTNEEKKLLDEKLTQLDVKNAKTLHKKIRVLYDYLSTRIERNRESKTTNLKTILETNEASIPGKNRLFQAFLQHLGIPTRLVHGVLLKDRSIKTRHHQWVQAYLNNQWINFDLYPQGHFASLPPNHFILYYGSHKPIQINRGVKVSHEFVISQVSEENAYDDEDLIIPQNELFDESYFKKEAHSQESYIKNALGRIAIITESPIKKSIIEKISEQAALSHTKVYFYSAPYESHFFRGTYIAKILNNNYETLSKTDAIFIQSEDDAGLYALFRMARNNKKLRKTSIFLNGNFSKPVGHTLGYTLYKLLKPKNLFIIPKEIDVERAWDLLQDNVLDGLPSQVVEKRWNVPVEDLSKQKLSHLSSWRQFLIKTWVLAAKAEVNLESIYLILILPVIALFIVIFRNIIGLETFGTFTPVIVSVAFLTTGLFWGISIFVVIVTTGVLFRILFRKIHIHLVARMAMLIAVVGLTMLVIMMIGVHLGWGALVNISILPMVIMAGIVENFTRTQMELGSKEALRLTIFTLFVSVLSYVIIDTAGIQSLILVFPELTLVAVLLEILIGRWNGIRLSEYVRFFKIIGPAETAKLSQKNES